MSLWNCSRNDSESNRNRRRRRGSCNSCICACICICPCLCLSSVHHLQTMGVEFEQNEQQDRESPQGRPTVAEEGERDTDNRKETDRHPDVNREVKEQDARHAVSIHTRKPAFLSFGQIHYAEEQRHKKENYHQAADPAVLLADSTKDKVGALFRNKFQLCLCPFQESFSGQAPAADRYFGLVHVITCA